MFLDRKEEDTGGVAGDKCPCPPCGGWVRWEHGRYADGTSFRDT